MKIFELCELIAWLKSLRQRPEDRYVKMVIQLPKIGFNRGTETPHGTNYSPYLYLPDRILLLELTSLGNAPIMPVTEIQNDEASD